MSNINSEIKIHTEGFNTSYILGQNEPDYIDYSVYVSDKKDPKIEYSLRATYDKSENNFYVGEDVFYAENEHDPFERFDGNLPVGIVVAMFAAVSAIVNNDFVRKHIPIKYV